MPIKVACECGQQFAARDELAGKRVKCPKCGAVLTIPQPVADAKGAHKQHLSELLDDVGLRAGLRRCPGCRAELSEAAVICIMCGYDTRLGRRLKTHTGSAIELDDEDLGELPVHGVEALDRAERQIARDKLEQKRMIKGTPWWMLLLALLGLIGFAIGMVSMPQEDVVFNSGRLLQVAGCLIVAYYFLRLLIMAFKESALLGLLCLILPPFYILTRWDRVVGLVIFMVVGLVVVGAGFVLLWVAPMLQGSEQSGIWSDLQPQVALARLCPGCALT